MKVIIKDKKWRDLLKRVEKMSSSRLRVGIFGDEGGSVDAGDGISLVEIGAIHEYGAPNANIPERSYIRRTFRQKEGELREMIGKVAKAIVLGKISAHRGLDILGAWTSSEIKKTITTGPHIPPPLKRATALRKGSDRPLVDTGRLVGAITWKVIRGRMGRSGRLHDSRGRFI